MIGVLFLGMAIDMFLETTLGAGLFSLGLGAIFMFAAFYQLKGMRALAEAAAADIEARHERLILSIAARNHGLVTPAAIVMQSRELTIAAARKLLDSLARDELCLPETDAQGNLCYRFALGQDQPEQDLSPEDWVDAMSARRRRLTGSETETASDDLDASL